LPHDDHTRLIFFKKTIQFFLKNGLADFPCFIEVLKEYSTITRENSKMMGWQEVISAAEQGVVIASHSLSHPPFNTLSEQDQVVEMRQSKQLLENKLQRDITHFVYPNGLFNADSHGLAQFTGYNYVYLLDDKIQDVAKSSTTRSRIPLYHDSYFFNILQVNGTMRLLKMPYRKMKSFAYRYILK
jgi:peptidoglycan/xylan/chitin deacetylase (PgdA/CDA1 family)